MASFELTSNQNNAVKETLLLIAGLACLTAAIALLLSTPAHALTLKGDAHMTEIKPVLAKTTTLAPQPEELPLPEDNTLTAQTAQTAEVAAPVVATASAAAVQFQGAAAPKPRCHPSNTFPVTFAGQWQCESIVVSSAVPDVAPGQHIRSYVNFVKSPQGLVSMIWSQSGWTSTLTSLRVKGENHASTRRLNQYCDGSWTANSRDRYTQVSFDQLVATSRVEQYVNGQYVGTYTTQSVLKRVEPMQTLSYARSK